MEQVTTKQPSAILNAIQPMKDWAANETNNYIRRRVGGAKSNPSQW